MSEPRIYCVATHHKTGTVWMGNVFRRISKVLGLEFVYAARINGLDDLARYDRAIVVSWKSKFPEEILNSPEARFLHIVRDPRDILLSGCSFHKKTDSKHEGFLYTPRASLGGRSYQEHLRALDNRNEELLFEMRNKHDETIQEIRSWNFDDPRSTELRYEDMLSDVDTELFAGALRNFGMNKVEVTKARGIYYRKSLFGGLAKGQDVTRAGHITSDKKVRWHTELPFEVAKVYAEAYGQDLIDLGYEKDNSWVERLQDETAV